MFSYYGSKSKLARLYPRPKFFTIIEPFAGSARYSLEHWEHDVTLYDKSPYVFQVWEYLLQASPRDVMNLPNVESGEDISKIKSLSAPERFLIGFHLCRGKAKPRTTGHGQNSWNSDKYRIAASLFKIKHWKVFHKSYRAIPQQQATYFVDPPYKVQATAANSDRYPCWQVDYEHLAEWVKTREGQVIVCEGEGADYLPFKPLARVNKNTNNHGTRSNMEYIYTQ